MRRRHTREEKNFRAVCMLPPLLGWSFPKSRNAGYRGGFVCTEDRCFTVPYQGRLRPNRTPHPSTVPSGLVCNAGCFPAFKRRAIFEMSLRDRGTRWPPFRQESNPIHEQCLQGQFAATVSGEEDVGPGRASGVQQKKMWDTLSLLGERAGPSPRRSGFVRAGGVRASLPARLVFGVGGWFSSK